MDKPYVNLLSSRTVTGSGNSGSPFSLRDMFNGQCPPGPLNIMVQSQITGLSGSATPGITIVIEDTVDGTSFRTIGTFAAQTTNNSSLTIAIAQSGVAQAAGFSWPFNADKIRIRWTTQGTNPNVTFNLKAVVL